jgi:hypothetical protein
MMNNENLSTYLNDHLAGATAALQLLDTLATMDGLERVAEELRAAIAADRKELESLMVGLSISISTARRVASWITAKMAELKVHVEDRGDGSLMRLELLEALALGVDGKRALWRVLDAVAKVEPALATLDYERLEQRAVDQRQQIEEQRVGAAMKGLRQRAA